MPDFLIHSIFHSVIKLVSIAPFLISLKNIVIIFIVQPSLLTVRCSFSLLLKHVDTVVLHAEWGNYFTTAHSSLPAQKKFNYSTVLLLARVACHFSCNVFLWMFWFHFAHGKALCTSWFHDLLFIDQEGCVVCYFRRYICDTSATSFCFTSFSYHGFTIFLSHNQCSKDFDNRQV